MLQTNKQVQDNRTQMQLFSLSHSYAYLLGCFPAKYTQNKNQMQEPNNSGETEHWRNEGALFWARTEGSGGCNENSLKEGDGNSRE